MCNKKCKFCILSSEKTCIAKNNEHICEELYENKYIFYLTIFLKGLLVIFVFFFMIFGMYCYYWFYPFKR